MPSLGPGELILALIIVLVVFGPGKLPEIGQAVGKGIREFRRAANDVTDATRIDAPPANPPANPPAASAMPQASTPPSAATTMPPAATPPADPTAGDPGQPSA